MDKTIVGNNAGKVWCALKEIGEISIPELARRLILCSTDENDIVLDPFTGSGTTLKVAKQLNRNGIGIEINKDYIKLAEKNINDLFTKVEIIKEECI